MNCELCGKAAATVHLTQTVGEHVSRIDLCEVCAKKGGVNDPTGFSLITLMEEVKKRKRESAG